MTHPTATWQMHTMDQIQFAVHRTAHGDYPGYCAEMAEYLGMSAQILRAKVNPNDPTHKLSLEEAVRMMRKDGNLAILKAMAAEFAWSPCERTPIQAAPLPVAIARTMVHQADIARSLAQVLDSGIITQAQLAKARQEISDAKDALDVLEQALLEKGREVR